MNLSPCLLFLVLPLAVKVAAVMILLPKIVDVTVKGIMIIRDAAEEFMKKLFSNREFYFGMDTALLIRESCIISTSLLLIPTALVLTVEAVRAGLAVAGKGFAVVADEVRRLASNYSRSFKKYSNINFKIIRNSSKW